MFRVLFIVIIFTILANASLFNFKKLWDFEKYYNKGEYKKALEIIEKYGKDTPVINYNKANTLYKLGRYDEALIYYKRAHSKDVNEIDRLFNIGNTFFKLKEYDKAIFTYKLILKFKDDRDTKINLKLALLKKLEEIKKKKEKQNKSKKKQKQKEKKGKKKSKKLKKRKLTKKELLKLKQLQKREKFKKELRKMLKKSLYDKKVPVLMYKIDGSKTKIDKNLKPW